MNFPKHQIKLFVVILVGTFALPVFSEDTPPKSAEKPAGQPTEAYLMDLAKPGGNHELLQTNLVGSWTYIGKMWFDPHAPAIPYAGTAVTKAIMGGRYFQSEHNSKMQMPGADGKTVDMDFSGMEIAGYDNGKKMFVSSWVDNMGTGILASQGTYDAATRTLTYLSEYEPMPGVKTKTRETLTFTDKDHHTYAFYEDRRGKEVKTMEMTCTRKD